MAEKNASVARASELPSRWETVNTAKTDASVVRANIPQAREENHRSPLTLLDPQRVGLDLFEMYCHEMLMTNLDDVGKRDLLLTSLKASRSFVVLI